jgi:hypothetical protein
VLVRPESIQEVEYDDTATGWGRLWGRWGWGQGDNPTGARHTPSTNVANEFDTASRERVQGGDQGVWTAQAPVTRAEMPGLRSNDERKTHIELQPATIDITDTKEEIRPGDRLVPEPVREFVSFVPRSPDAPQEGQIISVHGNAVTHAGQNQVVVINRGQDQGLLPGHVLQIWKDGILAQDKTDPDRPFLRLPKERNGLMIVFRSFNKLSYALVLQITDGVRIGDRFSNP